MAELGIDCYGNKEIFIILKCGDLKSSALGKQPVPWKGT